MQQQDYHATLRRILVARGIIDPAAPWQPFAGGRTNRIWKIGLGRNAIVCKLFSGNADTPMFSNSPHAEAAALRALAGMEIAPEFLALETTPYGYVVMYRFLEGQTWSGDSAPVAKLLGHIHALDPASHPEVLAPSSTFANRTDRMLSELPRQDRSDFMALQPSNQPIPSPKLAFLHGDPVPANIVATNSGPMLIDWQCPRIGDPCDDIAVFLSPAMQLLYAAAPLTKENAKRFLEFYPNSETAQRYQQNAAHYHWQMAIYCAWKIKRGHLDYQHAMIAELNALQRASE